MGKYPFECHQDRSKVTRKYRLLCNRFPYIEVIWKNNTSITRRKEYCELWKQSGVPTRQNTKFNSKWNLQLESLTRPFIISKTRNYHYPAAILYPSRILATTSPKLWWTEAWKMMTRCSTKILSKVVEFRIVHWMPAYNRKKFRITLLHQERICILPFWNRFNRNICRAIGNCISILFQQGWVNAHR